MRDGVRVRVALRVRVRGKFEVRVKFRVRIKGQGYSEGYGFLGRNITFGMRHVFDAHKLQLDRPNGGCTIFDYNFS